MVVFGRPLINYSYSFGNCIKSPSCGTNQYFPPDKRPNKKTLMKKYVCHFIWKKRRKKCYSSWWKIIRISDDFRWTVLYSMPLLFKNELNTPEQKHTQQHDEKFNDHKCISGESIRNQSLSLFSLGFQIISSIVTANEELY